MNGSTLPRDETGRHHSEDMLGVYNEAYEATDDYMDVSMDDSFKYNSVNDTLNTTANSQNELMTANNVGFRSTENDNADVTSPRDCGICSCRPSFIQALANIKVFLFVVCIISMFNGSLSSGYLPSVITSIEKRFQIGSTTSGLITASYEFGSVVAVVFVSYFGGKRCIPRWISCGVFVMAIGSLLFTLPHFVGNAYKFKSFGNLTDQNVCRAKQTNKEDVISNTFCTDENSGDKLFVFVFILAQLFIGVGSTPIFTLGTTYVDNHVTKKKAPALVAFLYAAAAVGPVVGFGLGALMLGLYVDVVPFGKDVLDELTEEDPRWVGAWWGGFLVIGIGLLLMVTPVAMFPKTIKWEKSKMHLEEELEKDASMVHTSENTAYGTSVKDIPKSILSLLKNPIYLLTCLGVSCEISIVSGFVVFLPKYLETQFVMVPVTANLLTGGVAVPGAVIGILLGGYVMMKFKLKSNGAVQLTLALNFIAVAGFCGLFLLGCPNPKIAGGTLPYYNSSGHQMESTNLTSVCNSNCKCSDNDIELICGSNGITYFSPCHAGCTTYFADNATLSNYTNCACISSEVNVGDSGVIKQRLATSGRCQMNCETLMPFMIVLFFMCMAVAATQTPLLIVTMRSVSEEERAFCLGMQFVILRFLAYIPAPILFGAIIDQTCMFWKKQCGRNGSCLLYDVEKFRYYYIGTCAGYKVLGAMFFIIVWLVLRYQKKTKAEFDVHVVSSDSTPTVATVESISAVFSQRESSTASFMTESTDFPHSEASETKEQTEQNQPQATAMSVL